MDIDNQDRKKHHKGEDCHSDEDFYSDKNCHDKKNQMCCPCMCPYMQSMNMNPQQMQQPMGCGQQMQQPMMGQMKREFDEQIDEQEDNEEMSDYRRRRPYYYGGFPFWGVYPPYGHYKHRPRPWNY